MKRIAALFAALQLIFAGAPVGAQDAGVVGYVRTVTTQSWVEEWDAASGQWVRVSEQADRTENVRSPRTATRYAQPAIRPARKAALAQYGPFIVTSATSAQMVGSTDRLSPQHFDAMIRDYPQLSLLEMVEAPGTSHDIANLEVARRLRANGIATHVPSNGSVRSGAVELFLAGAQRTLDLTFEIAGLRLTYLFPKWGSH